MYEIVCCRSNISSKTLNLLERVYGIKFSKNTMTGFRVLSGKERNLTINLSLMTHILHVIINGRLWDNAHKRSKQQNSSDGFGFDSSLYKRLKGFKDAYNYYFWNKTYLGRLKHMKIHCSNQLNQQLIFSMRLLQYIGIPLLISLSLIQRFT